MRRCSRCKESKPSADFVWHANQQRFDTYCKPCRSAYGREHYLANKQKYVSSAWERNRRVAEERWALLLDYFADHPCVDCGETDPIVLEFDHLNDKLFSISQGIRYRRWADVLAEMEKCEVVCANCHRRRTAARGGFLRAAAVAQRQSLALPRR